MRDLVRPRGPCVGARWPLKSIRSPPSSLQLRGMMDNRSRCLPQNAPYCPRLKGWLGAAERSPLRRSSMRETKPQASSSPCVSPTLFGHGRGRTREVILTSQAAVTVLARRERGPRGETHIRKCPRTHISGPLPSWLHRRLRERLPPSLLSSQERASRLPADQQDTEESEQRPFAVHIISCFSTAFMLKQVRQWSLWRETAKQTLFLIYKIGARRLCGQPAEAEGTPGRLKGGSCMGGSTRCPSV